MVGSRTLWNALLAEGPVDELFLMVGAPVAGGGTGARRRSRAGPEAATPRRQRREGSENVLLRYQVVGASGRRQAYSTWTSSGFDVMVRRATRGTSSSTASRSSSWPTRLNHSSGEPLSVSSRSR